MLKMHLPLEHVGYNEQGAFLNPRRLVEERAALVRGTSLNGRPLSRRSQTSARAWTSPLIAICASRSTRREVAPKSRTRPRPAARRTSARSLP